MQERLIILVVIELLMMISILVLVFLDLWAGLRKAKQRGETITSNKLRRSIAKATKYYNWLFALSVIDVLQLLSVWYLDCYYDWSMPLFPMFGFVALLVIGAIEIKSIMEPADEKDKKEMEQVTQLASAIVSHRSDPEELAKAVAKYLAGEKEEA